MADENRKAKLIASPMESNNTSKFIVDEFDIAVHTHGYNVYLDKAMRCPCVSGESGAALLNCNNCGGIGWFFFNRRKTKMLAQSINYSTQYKDWSEENRGTIKITSTFEDRIAFMDKITILNGFSIFNQVLNCSVFEKKLCSFLTYEPTDIIDVFLFQSEKEPLKRIEKQQFEFEDNFLRIDVKNFSSKTVSVRYEHHPQYCIIDINRDLMVVNPQSNFLQTCENGKAKKEMPISAIGRRLHYLLEIAPKFGEKLIDNSYE